MKFFFLIWSGIWRKPARTTLILLQVALAFALFGVLQGMKSGVERAVQDVRGDLLLVNPAAVGGTPLPVAHLERLRSVPGVKSVAYADMLIGTYQKPDQIVAALALDPSDEWLTLAPSFFKVLPKDLAALHKTRSGALITVDVGRRYGWKLGDRVPVKSLTPRVDGSSTWFFDVVGYIEDNEPGQSSLIAINYPYLDEGRARNQGTVRNFYAIIADPHQAAAMSERIDSTFANSSAETATASLRESAQQTMKTIGDLDFAIRAIVSAVLIALLFSISTLMMQSIRERVPELAVLKTVGFTDRHVWVMVIIEALTVCVAAAAIGLGMAMVLFPYAAKYVPGLSMPPSVLLTGLLGALLVALIGVAFPARMAARLPVVAALSGR